MGKFTRRSAAIAQLVERRIGNAEVTGPTPVSSLAQNPEYRILSFFDSHGPVWKIAASQHGPGDAIRRK